MKVLVTGATGFLGGYVVSEFARSGYDVVATGRNNARLQQLVDAATAAQAAAEPTDPTYPGTVTAIVGDLAQLAELDLSVDVVVHAAALSTVWGPWQDFYHTNVGGTQAVVDFCRRNAVRRLIFISSPSIYSQRGDRFHITESDFDPNNRLNNYIRSKIRAEQVASEFSGSVILRPRGLIGVGDTSIVPRLVHANDTIGIPVFRRRHQQVFPKKPGRLGCLRLPHPRLPRFPRRGQPGRTVIDLTCVENVAYATRLAAESPAAAGRVYNITNDDPRPVTDVVDELFTLLGTVPRYRRRNATVLYGVASLLELVYAVLRLPGEPPVTRYTVCALAYSQVLDISAARRDLGYEPIVSLDEGIRRYVESID